MREIYLDGDCKYYIPIFLYIIAQLPKKHKKMAGNSKIEVPIKEIPK